MIFRIKKSKFVIVCVFLTLIFFTSLFFALLLLENSSKFITEFSISKDILRTLRLTTQKSEADVEQEVRRLLLQYGVDTFRRPKSNAWNVANIWPGDSRITADPAPELGFILKKLATAKITSADLISKGTQLKILITLEERQIALLKPQWYKRDEIILGKAYDGWDRHNGEIVAFHLNRIMGFNRAPIVSGRIVDLAEEILPVATDRLLETFFIKDNNTCFYGKCLYCKGRESGVCANGTKIEAAIVHWLPDRIQLRKYRHPWGRTYKENVKARWEYGNGTQYCADVSIMPLYQFGRVLLDIVDASVFDYLVGNADRHHYEINNASSPMMLLIDNAKSFGNPYLDEESILSPLKHCKILREQTFLRLEKLRGGILVRVLKAVMEADPLAPLLTPPHYEALHRRLEFVLALIGKENIRLVGENFRKRGNLTGIRFDVR